MSRGKYSLAYKHWPDGYEFKYTVDGRLPEPWTKEMIAAGATFDPRIHMDGCDEEGYDRYGYSAFDADGNYVGDGDGVDRAGWTEMDYLTLRDISEDQRDTFYD